MLIVDASCLYEVVIGSRLGEQVRVRMQKDDVAAPHVIDVEVLSAIRRQHLTGRIDATLARQAVEDLRDSPIERYGHRLLLDRAWELRHNVRGWDAFYVALAEALGGTLLTIDQPLGRAPGLYCEVEVLDGQ